MTAENLSLDWRVLAFAASLSVLTALLSGWLPAWQASRFRVHELLKQGGRGASAGRAEQRSRNALVIVEVALSLTLLTGAALLIESLFRLRAEPMGYRMDGLVVARLVCPSGPTRRFPAACCLPPAWRNRWMPSPRSKPP